MTHNLSKYGLFEELFKESFYPELGVNSVALEHLLPSGLKNTKKIIAEKDTAGKEHKYNENLLYYYEQKNGLLTKVRRGHCRDDGERILFADYILKEYEEANAPKRCAKFFKKKCTSSLPAFLDFIDKLYKLTNTFELSATGRE